MNDNIIFYGKRGQGMSYHIKLVAMCELSRKEEIYMGKISQPGHATGSHLYFTINGNGQDVDPLGYL